MMRAASRRGGQFAIAAAAMAAVGSRDAAWGVANTNATWTGTGADVNWSTPGNWTPDVPGVVGIGLDTSIATFSGTPPVLAPNLDASYNVGRVVFGNGVVSGDFTINASNASSLLLSSMGAAPTASAQGQLVNTAGTPAVAGAHYYTVAAPIVLVNSSGTTSGNGAFYFAANGGSAVAGTSSFLRVSGTVSGSASTGNTSTLTLYGGNNTRALLNVNEIGGVIADGANGGALALAFQQGNQFGTNGSTTWILSGNNAYTGGTLLNTNGFGGTIQARNNAAFGTGAVTWTASGGNFDTLAFGTAGLNLPNAMVVTGSTAAVDTGLNSATLSGAISNAATAGNLRKGGVNTLTLTGPSTFTGTTTINAGTLSVASLNSVVGGAAASNLGAPNSVANGTIAIGSGGTAAILAFTGASGETTDRVVNLAGTTGGATLDQSGGGALKFASALTATGAGTKTLTLTGSTAGTGEIAGAIVDNLSGTNNTAVTKTGTGAWTLSAANSYTGATAVNVGTLRIANASALGNATGNTTVASGATLDLNGQSIAEPLGNVVGIGTAAGVGAITNSNAAAATITGAITAAGSSFSVGGTGAVNLSRVTGSTGLTLSTVGANTVTLGGGTGGTDNALDNAFLTVNANGGGTVILNKGGSTAGVHATNTLNLNNGTVQFGGTGAYQLGGGTLTVNGGTLDLNGTAQNAAMLAGSGGTIANTAAGLATLGIGAQGGASNQSFAGTVSGALALSKAGTGTQTLTNVNGYTGGTTISNGTLAATIAGALGSGNVTVGATGVLAETTAGSTNFVNDLATLSIASGGVDNLNYAGTDLVGSLVLGGVAQTLSGTYGSASSGADFQSALFGGTGTVTLLVPEPASLVALGGVATFALARRRRRPA